LNRNINESITYNNPNARNAKDLHFGTTFDRYDPGMGMSRDYQRIDQQKIKGNNKPGNQHTFTPQQRGTISLSNSKQSFQPNRNKIATATF
jgi:hypothetical protein